MLVSQERPVVDCAVMVAHGATRRTCSNKMQSRNAPEGGHTAVNDVHEPNGLEPCRRGARESGSCV